MQLRSKRLNVLTSLAQAANCNREPCQYRFARNMLIHGRSLWVAACMSHLHSVNCYRVTRRRTGHVILDLALFKVNNRRSFIF